MFIKEKEREAVSKEVGRDLVSLTRLLKKHEVRIVLSLKTSSCNVIGSYMSK